MRELFLVCWKKHTPLVHKIWVREFFSLFYIISTQRNYRYKKPDTNRCWNWEQFQICSVSFIHPVEDCWAQQTWYRSAMGLFPNEQNFDLDKIFITAWKSITKLVIFQSFVAKCCKMRIIQPCEVCRLVILYYAREIDTAFWKKVNKIL